MTESSNPATQHNALLSATVSNYRSLADPVTISLEAKQQRGEPVTHELQAVGRTAPFEVLPACGIFGANATGKSSMLRALAEMRHFVLGSFSDPNPHRDDLPFRPHFTADGEGEPTSYSVKLIVEGVRWDYSFAVGAGGVERETAVTYPKGRAVQLFARAGDEFLWHRSLQSAGKMLASLVREPSALILSAAVAINIEPRKGSVQCHPLMPLRRWFARNLTLCTRANQSERIAYTAGRMKENAATQSLLELMKSCDLGVSDIRSHCTDDTAKLRIERAESAIKARMPLRLTGHSSGGEDLIRLCHETASGSVEQPFAGESSGTKALVAIFGVLLEAMQSGTVLLVDELDVSLHPHITRALVGLFQNKRHNQHCAQVVFSAYDSALLSPQESGMPLRGDQMWFAKRDENGKATISQPPSLTQKYVMKLHQEYLSKSVRLSDGSP